MSWGDGETADVMLGQVLSEVAGKAGIKMAISPSMAGIARKYWAMGDESPLHFMQRMAGELGGVVKFSGKAAAFVSQTEFVAAKGNLPLGNVAAIWGENLIAWRLKPKVARAQIKQAIAPFYDLEKGIWDQVTKGIGGSVGQGAGAAVSQPNAAPNEAAGEQQTGGQEADAQREIGQGWVLIDGNPQARAGMDCVISGARPGVDGGWQIAEAEHLYSRATGYQTRLTLDFPSAGSSGRGGSGSSSRPEAAPNAQ
jgi:phage protein D